MCCESAFAVVELVQEVKRDKRVDDTRLSASREMALEYLQSRYAEIVGAKNSTCGILTASKSDDGWYDIVDGDGDRFEAYLSEKLKIAS